MRCSGAAPRWRPWVRRCSSRAGSPAEPSGALALLAAAARRAPLRRGLAPDASQLALERALDGRGHRKPEDRHQGLSGERAQPLERLADLDPALLGLTG